MKRTLTKIGTCLCALAFAVAMAGCTANTSSVSPEQQANRAYMSQVNEIMAQLDEQLDSFVEAVSRGDVVNMRTQADNAYQQLDKLSDLEVPDGFSDIQQGYLDGTTKLREALDGYIELYAATESATFDQSTYATRLAQVQSLYDEGVAALKQADESAASMQ